MGSEETQIEKKTEKIKEEEHQHGRKRRKKHEM